MFKESARFRWCAIICVVVATFIGGILCEKKSIFSDVEEATQSVIRPLYVESWPAGFEEIEIISSADGAIQKAMVYQAIVQEPAPLLISLHTWAGDYKTPDPIAKLAQQANWNYIHPDFRGPNDNPNACLSENVISDIDDAIIFGVEQMKANLDQVMVVGMSGGGHAALGHLAASRGPRVRTYAAWCPVTDVEAWYNQLTARGEQTNSLLACCQGANQQFDPQEARNRSPIAMPLNPQRLSDSTVLIRAGVLDGAVGKVPFEHSVNFFNRCCRELDGETSQVSDSDQLSIHQASAKKHGRHASVFSKSFGRIHLNLFFGHHEFLPKTAIDELSRSLDHSNLSSTRTRQENQ